MRFMLVLVTVLVVITNGCAGLTINPTDYRDIRRCNDKIDMQRLERPEWNKNYEECIIQRYIPF